MATAIDRFSRSLESSLIERHAAGFETEVVLACGSTDWKRPMRRLRSGRRLILTLPPHTPPVALVGFARRKQLTVSALVPYGALDGGVLSPLDRPHRWTRLTSWLDSDPDLAALARLLEERWVSTLPPRLGGGLMVVVDKSTGRGPVESWDARCVEGWLARDSGLQPEIADLSTRQRPRYFLFLVVSTLSARQPGFDPSVLLTPGRLEQYRDWERVQRIDEEATRVARTWSEGCQQRRRDGLDVTLAADYDLVRQLLEQHYSVFRETRR